MRSNAARLVATLLLLATIPLAHAEPTYGRSMRVDIATQDTPWSNVVTRGESFNWRVDLFFQNTSFTNETLSGYMRYASNTITSSGVQFNSITSSASGRIYFAMSAVDSMGLSTNATSYPLSYPAEIVLTNATGSSRYMWKRGVLTVQHRGGISGDEMAAPGSEFNISNYTWNGVFPLSAIPPSTIAVTNNGATINGSPITNGAAITISGAGLGDMVAAMYDPNGVQRGVVFTNDQRVTLAVTSGVFVAGLGVTNVGGVLQIGSNGIVGATGATGPQGPAGSNGAAGATGPAGTNGATGATGPQGPAGTNGATGATGPQGPAGTNGTNGLNGTNGTNGLNGTNGANAYLVISAVNTLPAGSQAYASNNLVGTTNNITLGIPQGADGTGGGGGGGPSNIAVAGVTGTLTGSGSNVVATVSLASLAGGGVTTNGQKISASTNADWAAWAASATNAVTVTGPQSTLIATALQPTSTQNLVTVTQLATATNAAVIDATNRVAGVGYLLPASTQNLATATQLSTATNAAVIDATNRVAGVGYLLPVSTQNLVTVSQLATATNAAIIDATNRIGQVGYLLPASTQNLVTASQLATATNSAVIDATQRVSSVGYLLPASTQNLVTVSQLSTATNAAIIDATNRVAGVGYLLPASTQGLATATQLATATNSAIIDATNRVAGVGYLLPPSTQGLATVAYVDAATNAAVVDATNRVAGVGYLLPVSTQNLVSVSQLATATNAAIIDATNRVASVGYLFPASTQNLVTVTQLATATNAAIIDATNRVAGVGYLLSASTQGLAAVTYVDSATNAIDAAFIESKGGLTNAWKNPSSATNWMWTSDGTQITLTGYTGPNAVVIPDMLDGLPVTKLGTGLFATKGITNVNGGERITTIGDSAFGFCFSLKSFAFPSAQTIGTLAFTYCTNINSVTLPAAKFIGENAFESCSLIVSVSLPAATNVGSYAFDSCSALRFATFEQDAPPEQNNVFGWPGVSVTNYVINPTAAGWGATWNGRPVVRLPLYGNGANLTNITAAQVGAVSNGGATINGSPITNGAALTISATGAVSAAEATNIAVAVMSLAPVKITDARFYLSGLSNVAQSVRAKFSVSQKANNRCTDLVFLYTNQLYFSCTSTVSGVADGFSNVVIDASGFIVNDMYTKPDASQATWQTVSNASATVVSWNCSNIVATAAGTTISRVNRFRVPDYYDATGGSNIFCNLQFLTPTTQTVAYSVTYWSRTNFYTATGSQRVTNSAAITIPYVR